MYGEMNLDTLEAASGCSTQITDGVPYENCDSSVRTVYLLIHVVSPSQSLSYIP
eukprot:m.70363 g.70363  ORF g.70363 m.70363 type:complete len:54 (-) comp8308_c0_seq1:4868-5029(-)